MASDIGDDQVVADAPFGVARLTPDGVVAACNEAYARLSGVEPAAAVGTTFLSAVTWRDRATIVDALADLDRGRRRVTVEHRLDDVTDGEPTWCRTTLTRAVGATQTTAYVEDVTEQRLAVLLLRETERQYRAAFEGSPVGQAVCTLDGVVLRANRALARLFGCDVEGLLGGRLSDRALDQSPVSEDDLLALVRGQIASLEAERRFRHGSGRDIHARVHLTLRRDRTGQPAELLVAVTDVTRRTIAERDRATALTKLQDTLAELERSNDDLEHFASVASHDLKAPLTTVIGFLETLELREAEHLTSQGRTFVRAALRGAKRMERMMASLLEYARRNRAPLEIAPVDVRDVVDGAVSALSSEIATAGADVRVGPLPIVPADRASLDIVLQNLLANAVKFRRDGIPCVVAVSARHIGDTWHLRVEDNGIGVPADQRDAIFEMFGRRETGRRFEGHGIGLATVARAVQRHGGEVWVEDGRDGGSCFVVALPVHASSDGADLEPPARV